MGKKLIKDSTLTGIADAIRAKGGTTGTMTPQEMPEKIAAIPTGGDIDALIDKSITEISSSSATSIGTMAFIACSSLTTVDFPVVTSIDEYAFTSCSSLTTADFPAATFIGKNSFASCTSLTTADFPVATATGESAFENCTSLTTVDFPAALLIGIGSFASCISLTTVKFPAAKFIEASAFSECSSLTTADFPAATSISNNAFAYCNALKALLLRGNNVCNLQNANAFNSTPIASGNGYIYVPSALIEQYKVATNWSTYASQFRALEDYTVDGTVTGELDPSKVGV